MMIELFCRSELKKRWGTVKKQIELTELLLW